MKVGLFIGRFQPLHRGHLLIMKKLAPRTGRFIVGLGSTNIGPSCENPFAVEERREMVVKVMKEIGIRHFKIVELPDFARDEEWVRVVRRTVGDFDIAWSGDPWVIRVFKAQGLPIEQIKEFPGYSATKIRRRMVQGLPWLKYIPLSTRKYLREIGAVKRVRTLCRP